MDLAPPHEVRRIARRLEEAGHAAWAVGGAVRDAIAGIPAGDWDLTTSARPQEVRRLFRRTVPVGIEHGTVGVLGKDGRMYEVTTFRRDVETFGRRARVSFSDTLEEDLERRDFTINAIAWHPVTGELRDPHRGRRDLRAGVLRTVRDPAERFAEDRLRVLRALRFAGRFGLRVETRTWEALRDSADKLGLLSAERIREELFKVLRLSRPSEALRLYAESGVLRELYPELDACRHVQSGGDGDLWTHLLRTVDAVSPRRPVLRLAALLHDIGWPVTGSEDGLDHAGRGAALARALMQRLKCSNADTDRVTHLVAQHADLPGAGATDTELRRWLRRVGPEFVPDLFRLRYAAWRADHAGVPTDLLALHRRVRRMLRERPPLEVSDLAIGGAELRDLGIRPGPRYGEILRALLEQVLEDPALNEPERLRALAREMEASRMNNDR